MEQQALANTLSDTPTYIGSVYLRRWKWLWFRKEVKLSIQPLPIGKTELIGSIFLNMTGADAISKLSQSDQINKLLATNIDPLINAVGLAVCSKDNRPSQEMLDAIKGQFTMAQLNLAINEVYRRLDLSPFFDILSLTKSLTASLMQDQVALGQE